MTAAQKLKRVSIEDYLQGELTSEVKHEYVGGIVYAMAGARNIHNQIASNWLVTLGSQLRQRPCLALGSDAKVRIRLPTQTRFYYPDGMIVCESNAPDETFHDNPIVLAEVLSETTRRTDEGEKSDAYLTIRSLAVYMLIETDRPRVVVYRREGITSTFAAEVYEGLDTTVPLEGIGCTLAFSDLYARVRFEPFNS